VHFLAGGLAGAGVDSVFFPIDTLKTRLQMRRAGAGAGAALAGGELTKKMYSGLGVNFVGSFLSSGAFFVVYEGVKRWMQRRVAGPDSHWAPLVHMASAAAADVGSCVLRVPFELTKQRLQGGVHASAGEAVRALLRERGLRGLYTGFASTVMREVPFDALEFALYEFARREFLRRSRKRAPSGLDSALLGAIVGGAAAAATTPLDVAKTRLMTQTTRPGEAGHYRGVWHCLATVAREEGARGLFRGVAPRTAWIALGGSVFFSVYETARRVLDDAFDARETRRRR
jgi:solute carrier family 25 S-adenosylmethionine transporter 26